MTEKSDDKIRVRPLFDRVLLEVEDIPETTEGGIVLPDSARKNPQQSFGKVLATGPGRHEHGAIVPMSVKVGDRVIWEGFPGKGQVTVGGKQYVILREWDIQAIVEKSTSAGRVIQDGVDNAVSTE